MAKLLVKTESLPARCEICHQKDLFDSINNYCLRCKLSAKPSRNNKQIAKHKRLVSIKDLSFLKLIYLFFRVFLGAFAGVFFSSLFIMPYVSAHDYDLWPIILIPCSAILGQVALPFIMLVEQGNYSKIFFAIFSYSLVSAITVLIVLAIKQHFFLESYGLSYSSTEKLLILMVGIILGPILGIGLSYFRYKITNLIKN